MNTSSDTREIRLSSWPPRIDDGGMAEFTSALTDFVLARRWYRTKARRVTKSRIRDVIAPGAGEWSIALLELEFAEGDRALYLCTLAASDESRADGPIVGHLRLPDGPAGVIQEGLGEAALARALLEAIAQERSLDGAEGRLAARRTRAFASIAGPQPDIPARASKAEQSNSALFYGEKFILKLFRRLDEGVNPDYEIGRFLTERGFEHTPAVAGHIEYQGRGGAPMSVGILQQFVPNQGDAWEFTLAALRENRPYVESARLLGQRTAEMHIALAAEDAGPEFAPEPMTAEAREALYQAFLAQMETALRLVREKPAEGDAERLLALEPAIRERFRALRETPVDTVRIRNHGDYHLGQVLAAGSDFMIIDFEGEPARTLAERRAKGVAMRDVAGMVRSFQYAAYSALPGDPGRADSWTAEASQSFLDSYLAAAEGQRFLPARPEERKLLLDVFVLEKALYEVAYELNNRPDWVRIPLRGIVSLLTE